jgi:hypothetical protein
VYAKTSGRQKPFNDLPRHLASGELNPEWIGNARREDTALNKNPYCTLPTGCLVWWTGGGKSQAINARYPISGSVSYVTGSRNFKAGFQWTSDRTALIRIGRPTSAGCQRCAAERQVQHALYERVQREGSTCRTADDQALTRNRRRISI